MITTKSLVNICNHTYLQLFCLVIRIHVISSWETGVREEICSSAKFPSFIMKKNFFNPYIVYCLPSTLSDIYFWEQTTRTLGGCIDNHLFFSQVHNLCRAQRRWHIYSSRLRLRGPEQRGSSFKVVDKLVLAGVQMEVWAGSQPSSYGPLNGLLGFSGKHHKR